MCVLFLVLVWMMLYFSDMLCRWAEVRIPWMWLFLIAIGGCIKQYDNYGYVSANQAFMVLASGLQINA